MPHLDSELAESILQELRWLRLRATSPTAVEVQIIANKAAIGTDVVRLQSRKHVENVRAETWLGICELASVIAENRSQPEISAQLATAIDLAIGWMRAAQ
jgi:hypothetical protein